MELTKEDMNYEETRLKTTIDEINHQIDVSGIKITDDSNSLKEFQRLRWEMEQEMDKGERYAFVADNDLKISMLNEQTKKIRRLYKIKDNPYFASIVFNDEPIYIGITSLKKEDDYLVCDWRAPICSLFYDYGVGKAEYKSQTGVESGIISKKRQYKIEKGILKHVFDTNINIDDDLLQDVLAQTSSEKMKNIVNTIQAEQNMVIRDDKTANIIVQGIAGSGKTSVALHRVAFLLYKLEYLTSGNVVIFSPNNVFTEYISDVLPDLGEDNTLQTTMAEFASSNICEYDRVEGYNSFVERYYKGTRQDNDLIRFKLSDEIIPLMEKFCKLYTKAARFTSDLVVKTKTIPMDEINELLHIRYNNKPLFERIDLISEKLNNVYFKGNKREYNLIKSGLLKIANFKSDYREIYKYFFESMIFQDNYKFNYRRNENIRNLNAKVLRYEDATIFIYMKCLLEGYPYQVAMREVVIDEAQDYTYLQYKMFKKIFKNAHFTILGDVNQTVNPFYKYDSLEKLLEIFDEDSKYIELNKTYRSSPEIIEYANSILNLNHVSAIRKNVNLPVLKRSMSDLKHIGRDVKYLKKKYRSVAIITKSIEEARIIAEGLRQNYDKVSLIDNHIKLKD
jgi:DNA helicase-2/ATP-dependent DNA helicase PcrA